MERTRDMMPVPAQRKRLGVFERYLSVWVGLCMVFGVLLGQLTPQLVQSLRSLEFGTSSHINLPIALLIWLMIVLSPPVHVNNY